MEHGQSKIKFSLQFLVYGLLCWLLWTVLTGFLLYVYSHFGLSREGIGTLGLAGAVALVIAYEDRKLQYSRFYPGEPKRKFNHLFYKGLISSGGLLIIVPVVVSLLT
ncbi:hypothetical protein [Alkalibacillus haloalkaliphilus]|uniref:Uncharacterized protein n=1 Tax=Alkalibacillus haloalkaliphilus TaxID=94136 RepID=A0A511W3D5_9BACI|nr:hypothetical protein [Alkalibacillus haloalkaliphilus]GEN45594.1 hypothetical protein AHA02nite_13700 [Alkalibacillus haloalkaliphilus]